MIYESELYHHGIRGQKWGKRNGPPYPLDRKAAKEKYGMTKHQVKREEWKAKKNYNKENGSQSPNQSNGYGQITGRNWKQVYDKHAGDLNNDKKLNDLVKKTHSAYVSASKAQDAGDTKAMEKYASEGKKYGQQLYDREVELGKKYSNQYQTALLKDIGYQDVKLGKEMLNQYGITNNLGKASKMVNDLWIKGYEKWPF